MRVDPERAVTEQQNSLGGFTPIPGSTIATLLGGLAVYGLFFMLGLPAIVTLVLSGDATWVVDIGGAVSTSLEWSIPSAISVLIAFYAVVIGGQILDIDNLRAIRNSLGMASCVIGAACIVALGFLAAYATATPKAWATFAVLTPFVVLVVFLALNIGFMMTGRGRRAEVIRTQLIDLEGPLERVAALTRGLTTATPGPRVLSPVVLAVVCVGIAMGATINSANLEESSAPATFALFGGLLISSIAAVLLTYAFRVAFEAQPQSRLLRAFPAGYALLFGVSGLAFFFLASTVTPVLQRASMVMGVSLVLVTLLAILPDRTLPASVRSITIRGGRCAPCQAVARRSTTEVIHGIGRTPAGTALREIVARPCSHGPHGSL